MSGPDVGDIGISFGIVNGISIGLEHLTSDDEEDEYQWMVVLSLIVFRVFVIKF